MPLDGHDLHRELSKNCRGVAGAGAHLEHPRLRSDPRRLRHQRNHVGLRDGLALANRQRIVVVGGFGKLGGHEGFARHAAESRQHALVGDAAP